MSETRRSFRPLVWTLGGAALVLAVIGIVTWLRSPVEFNSGAPSSFDSLGENAFGYGEYRHRDSGVVFVLVPPSEIEHAGVESDSDAFEVEKGKAFLIAKYEVTREEWARVLDGKTDLANPRRPVSGVSWSDCVEFCERVGFVLPTEHQWASACGDLLACDDIQARSEFARHLGNTSEGPREVGKKAPNRYGVFDIRGNVAQWCRDRFRPADHGYEASGDFRVNSWW